MFFRHVATLLLLILNATCEDKGFKEILDIQGGFKVISSVKLPDAVNETSGLELWDSLILTINDSGNDPVIYGINPVTGKQTQSWYVQNAQNKDWEDITRDADYLYIGDFGNNIGTRKDQMVYKVALQQMISSDTVIAQMIHFSFEDQTSFLPSIYNHSFDCEAMVSAGNDLILYTKDWKNKITTAYQLSKQAGEHQAKRMYEFPADGLVTGADFSEESKTLVMCGYVSFNPFIWKIKGINIREGTYSDAEKYEITNYSGIQNEGIVFTDTDSVYMSAEARYVKQSLYLINLKDE